MHRLLVRSALGATLVAAFGLVSFNARADLPSPPAPVATPGPSPSPQDDSRFGEIGHVGPEAKEATPSVAAGIGGTQVGHVTYAGARVDVPLSKKWSIIPQAAILRVQPLNDGDPVTVNSYLGAGLGYRPGEGWSMEASAVYGPRAWGLMSIGGAFSVSKEVGADWPNDTPPWVTIESSVAVTRFDWADGNGPAGQDIVQGYLEAQALFQAGRHFQITPKGMFFVYDHTLTNAQGERLGTVSTLARIGTYAPLAMVGLRLGYVIGGWLTPFVEGQQIAYAASIGDAQRIVGGARAKLGRDAALTAYGGAILNHVSGPLVPTDEVAALQNVPIVGLEAEWAF